MGALTSIALRVHNRARKLISTLTEYKDRTLGTRPDRV
jgi:hypothetical protein